MLRRLRLTPPPPSPPSYRKTRSIRSSLSRCAGTIMAAGIITTGITGVGIIAIGIGTIGTTAIGVITIVIGNCWYWREAGNFPPLFATQQKTPPSGGVFPYRGFSASSVQSDRAATSIAPDESQRAGAHGGGNHYRPLNHDGAGHDDSAAIDATFAIGVTV